MYDYSYSTTNSYGEKLQQATIELRRKTLADGFAFMYFLESLPGNQVIYEYPDGRFQVEQIKGVDTPAHYLRPATGLEVATIRNNWLNEY